MRTDMLYRHILEVCKEAYLQGRQDQYEEDCPEEGMSFKKSFEDTDIYKHLSRKIFEEIEKELDKLK